MMVRRAGFEVPSAAQRLAAIGPRAGLSPALERALFVHDSFAPVPCPGPGGWLASQPEPGQTFAQFVTAPRNVPTPERRVLYVLPIGDLDARHGPPVAVMRAFAGAFYALPVRALPAVSLAEVGATSRVVDSRGGRQLLTTDILAYLERRLPEDAFCLAAFTREDLYPAPSWNFVFGQASLRHRVGVYSFARYHPSFYGRPDRGAASRRAILRRSLAVMVHEIGHMFGIQHCVFFACVLNGSNSLDEADRRPLHLCPVDLRKLAHAIGFDVVQRYQALGAFYRAHHLDDQARWTERRIAEVLDEHRSRGRYPDSSRLYGP